MLNLEMKIVEACVRENIIPTASVSEMDQAAENVYAFLRMIGQEDPRILQEIAEELGVSQ